MADLSKIDRMVYDRLHIALRQLYIAAEDGHWDLETLTKELLTVWTDQEYRTLPDFYKGMLVGENRAHFTFLTSRMSVHALIANLDKLEWAYFWTDYRGSRISRFGSTTAIGNLDWTQPKKEI